MLAFQAHIVPMVKNGPENCFRDTLRMGLTTIIYAHPWEGSFNHAILQQVKALLDARGQEYRLLDLHADRFNPVYSVDELALFNKGQALDPQVLSYQQTLKGVGVPRGKWINFGRIGKSTPEKRQAFLDRLVRTV